MGGRAHFTPGQFKDFYTYPRSHTMIIRHTLSAAFIAIALLSATGCAVTRGQETVGAYVDDAAITTAALIGAVIIAMRDEVRK